VTRVAAALLAASCLSLFGASQRQPAGGEMAVTIDDLPTVSV